MAVIAVFLRGVNVGGKNILPMKQLVRELESIGIKKVKTYIQTGNVIVDCCDEREASLASDIQQLIQSKFGFCPAVISIPTDKLSEMVSAFNISENTAEDRVHLFFLEKMPENVDSERLKSLCMPAEIWDIKGSVFYLYAPDGIRNSKLAAQVEKIIGIPATARNLRTVKAVLSLADNI
ncbi:MAG: DUF1697 domain-containing protein [Deferribacterales bacterium]